MKQASVVLVLILLLVAQLNSFAEQVHENTQSNEIDRSDFAVDLAAKAGRSEALTTKAEGSIKKKEYRTAEKLLLEALTIDDSNVEATISLAMLYESLGRVSVACKYFHEVIFPTHRVSSSVGNRPTFRLHYAILLSKSHEWEQAVAIYRGAISKFESDIANHPPYQMFDFDSESVNSSLLESSAHILIGLFESGFTQPTPQENLAHFKEAARLEPNLAIVQFYYGYGLEHVGKNPAAKAAYQKAIRYSDRDSYLQLKAKEFLNTVGQKGWFTPEPPKAAGKPEKKP